MALLYMFSVSWRPLMVFAVFVSAQSNFTKVSLQLEGLMAKIRSKKSLKLKHLCHQNLTTMNLKPLSTRHLVVKVDGKSQYAKTVTKISTYCQRHILLDDYHFPIAAMVMVTVCNQRVHSIDKNLFPLSSGVSTEQVSERAHKIAQRSKQCGASI